MVLTYELLKVSWKKASKGKKDKNNQARYEYYLEDNLFFLKWRLENGKFKPAPLKEKEIFIPKYRIAQVPGFEDKIVQHFICDNYLYDIVERHLIKETSACLKNRGDKAARNLVKQYLHKYYRTYGSDFYVLKCDIHNYFASIDHKRLKSLIDQYIEDEDLKKLMLLFTDMTEHGLPLGLQQNQLLANLYLSEMDHKIKSGFRVQYYGRHMDDFYIISDDPEYLREMWQWIDSYVQSIGLELNPKTGIFHNTFDFLGFTFKLTETGKVIMKLQKTKRKTQRNRLRLQVRQLANGNITAEKLAMSYQGWRTHALNGNCRNLVLATDEKLNMELNDIGYSLKVKRKGVIEIVKNDIRIDSRNDYLSR